MGMSMMPGGGMMAPMMPGGPVPGFLMAGPNGPVPGMMMPPPAPQQAEPGSPINAVGETLYALVEELNPVLAGKITGMLLEMDHEDVMELLKEPEALRAKVDEAVQSLNEALAQQQ